MVHTVACKKPNVVLQVTEEAFSSQKKATKNLNSVPDPDPHVFGPPGSGSTSQRYGSGSFYHHAKILRKTFIPTILLPFCTFHL